MVCLTTNTWVTQAENQSRLPMGNKSKWFLPISSCIIPTEKGNLSFQFHTHHRISIAQLLYQNHQCPQVLRFSPSHPTINVVPLPTVTNPLDGFEDPYWPKLSSLVVSHNPYLNWILYHSLDLRTLRPIGTAELTRNMDLTLLKNWIPDYTHCKVGLKLMYPSAKDSLLYNGTAEDHYAASCLHKQSV